LKISLVSSESDLVRCSVPSALGSRFSPIDLHVACSAVFCTCCRRRSSEFDLALACSAASRVRTSLQFSSINLQVAWSAVFCDFSRRRSSDFDLALACASASRMRWSPRFSSIALQVARLSVFLNRSLAQILSLLLLWKRAAEFREWASTATSKLLVLTKQCAAHYGSLCVTHFEHIRIGFV